MRILLLAPRSNYPDVTPGWLYIPQMTLLVLQALSGNEHHVVIAEEDRAPLPLDEKWDLVGITAMTATAPRAYALAKRFRRDGAKVILGGVHPTMLPEEAGQHADAVLQGEAEALWPRILEDVEHNRLQRVYSSPTPEVLDLPLVDYRHKKTRVPTVSPVIATRGCPHECDFCSATRLYGRRVRKLPLPQVLAQVGRHNGDYLAFLDDNLTANREYASELFSALRNLQVKILAQASVSFILEDGLFNLAVEAGLKGIFIGVETIEEKSRQRLRKSVTLDAYGTAIQKCREAGVMLHGSFIFGMDEHDTTIFARTLDFIMEHKIPSVSGNVLTPYPGTPLFHRLLGEGRLLHRNWAFYDMMCPVFRPARMSVEELAEGYEKFRRSLFSFKGIARRFPAGFAVNPYAFLQLNVAMHRTTSMLREHHQNYFNWLKTSCPPPPLREEG
jgi:radical SAM superfamily enzyme YgiQ (UPF0313 family)